MAAALANPGALTADSLEEQRSAGLDACSKEELDEFDTLNGRYRENFGFPFIMAVRGKTRHQILEQFRRRVEGEPAAEFDRALQEVIRIVQFRVETAVDAMQREQT